MSCLAASFGCLRQSVFFSTSGGESVFCTEEEDLH